MKEQRSSNRAELGTQTPKTEVPLSRYLLPSISKETAESLIVSRDLPVNELLKHALKKQETQKFGETPRSQITKDGAFAVITHPDTGRSPKDKFIVTSESKNIWFKDAKNSTGNNEIGDAHFTQLHTDTLDYLKAQKDLYEQNLFLGTDPKQRKHVRLLTNSPWHAAFADRMYVVPSGKELEALQNAEKADLTIVHAPDFQAESQKHGTRKDSGTAIALNFDKKAGVIVGTQYGGEVKKFGLTVAMGELPQKGVLPMHSSAVVTDKGESAVFFGLSGTGKTTLSSAPEYTLIGDDEHGWSDDGVFNIEGGCYPKTIKLSKDLEPEIWDATNKKDSIMENVVVRPDGTPDFDDISITENTRAAFTLQDQKDWDGKGGHPKNIIFLTADATGVLPPVAKLTPEQAQYYFVSGYTSKVAGTEKGVTEPEKTFSPCFAGPFLPIHPTEHAKLLAEKVREQNKQDGVNIWMVNTGWTGDAYDSEGNFDPKKRMKLPITRALVKAITDGELDNVDTTEMPVFGLHVPTECPNVNSEDLKSEKYWKGKEEVYKEKVKELAGDFNKNFELYTQYASEAIRNAAPKL